MRIIFSNAFVRVMRKSRRLAIVGYAACVVSPFITQREFGCIGQGRGCSLGVGNFATVVEFGNDATAVFCEQAVAAF